ncbi:MAG: outer membrane protein assembly factor BamD [Deltaproteobacteria bacterium]|nr:outer membrane protein assembly factor BamD [Deltaproteobacteria bacterium]
MEKTGVRGQKRRCSSVHCLLPTAYCLLLTVFLLLTGCAWTKGAVKGGNPASLYTEGERLYQKGQYSSAADKLKTVMEEYPLSQEANDAQLLLADTYYSNEQYEDGASYYTNFVGLHPGHPKAPYAQFQKGMSYFKQVLTIDRDQTATKKALLAFQDLVASYPKSVYADRAKEMIAFLRRRLAEREFYIGSFYFKDKNYRGALARFAEVLKTYPDVGLADKALYYIGESYRKLGEKDLAREAFSTLVSNFPNSPFARDARGRLERI